MSGSNTTSVPSPTFGAAGFVAPAEQDILAGVQADMNAALGGNANQALATPQGQLAVSLAAIVGDCDDQFLLLANGVDPAFASGRMQDAIGRIYFQTRLPAVSTTVSCTCGGTAGTVIPAGTLIQDPAGNEYASVAAGTIGTAGVVTIQFACTVAGPVQLQAGTVSIYQSVAGWNSVTNPKLGIIGRLAENRTDFEYRRAQSVAGNSSGTNGAILGAVLAVPGVTDAYVVDNSTPTATTIGGVLIAPNSVYVVVSGGDPAAIGLAILSKKPPGCGYTGSTTIPVQDPNPAYTNPPSYTVAYDIATATPIYIQVTIANSANVPSDALAQIQAAVIAAFTGDDGYARARIAATLYASRYYAGVATLGAWAQIVQVTIGTAASPTANDVVLNINQEPTIVAANITLVLV